MNLLKETRGFRNNNPGNIRHTASKWDGLALKQTDNDFCKFMAVNYGIRAIYRLLVTYRKKYNIKSVREIVTRWAPPVENNTESYVKSSFSAMKKLTGLDVNADTVIWTNDKLVYALIYAIIRHENGICPFNLSFIKKCTEL